MGAEAPAQRARRDLLLLLLLFHDGRACVLDGSVVSTVVVYGMTLWRKCRCCENHQA